MEQALVNSEQQYRALFDHAADTILIIDPDTADIRDFNKRAFRNLNYAREEFRSLRICDFDAVASEKSIKRHIARIVQDGNATFETKHRTKDGTIKDVLVNSTVIRLDKKKYIQSICHDITERKQIEAEREKINANLEAIVNERTNELNELNSALKILLKKSEENRRELEDNIQKNYENTISPFLGRIKNTLITPDQKSLFEILEKSFMEVLSPYSNKIADPMLKLTPAEIQVSTLIRQGMSNKEIATTLHTSLRTVTNHRTHIRKKLGLTNRKINLRAYLLSK